MACRDGAVDRSLAPLLRGRLRYCDRLRGQLRPQPASGDAKRPFALAELVEGLGLGWLNEDRSRTPSSARRGLRH